MTSDVENNGQPCTDTPLAARTLRTLLSMDSKELYCFDIEIHTVRILRLAFPQYRAASGVDQPAHQPDPAIDQIYVCP